MRTRIKMCGFTRQDDVRFAVSAGVDSIGLVFYNKSQRYVDVNLARELSLGLPAFVSLVGLFVNADVNEVSNYCNKLPISLLQFHGDESAVDCATAAQAACIPFIRAFRVKNSTLPKDLIEFDQMYQRTSPYYKGLLLDTHVEEFGGSGKVFDWSIIPKDLAHRVVLSGGLTSRNVIDAISSVRPYAVDVSSGIEFDKGIKNARLIDEFVSAVHRADRISNPYFT